MRSQRPGDRPVWFWTKQRSPAFKGGNGRECSLRRSEDFTKRARRAISLERQASRHSRRTDGFENFSSRLTKENASRSCLPKTISAGDIQQSGSGVLRNCSSARSNLSLSRAPVGVTLERIRRFAVLTATSARPFDWGWWAAEIL